MAKGTDWRSIYVASILGFCSAIQFSLYYSSMWPFLEKVDSEVNEQSYGFVVAACSVAQCISGPLFGYWSNRVKQISLPMYFGLAAMVFGNILYVSIEAFSSYQRYVMMVARFFIGIGSANLPLLKTYGSTSCIPADRAQALVYINGGMSLGVTLGPGLQLLFTPFGFPGIKLFGDYSINMYTAPAYAACVFNIICMIMMAFWFKESYSGIIEDNGKETRVLPKFNKIAVAICNLTRFAQDFYYVNIESITAPFAMTVLALTNQETVKYNSMMNMALGVIAFFTFITFIIFKLGRFMPFRLAVVCSLVLILVFHLVTFSWPFIPGSLTTYSNHDLEANNIELVGCNVDKNSWCMSMRPINPWLYYVTFAICSGIAIPYLEICNSTVYGQVLGPRRQGTMQGLLQFTGGIARIFGPIIAGALYITYGPTAIWLNGSTMVVITILLWIVFRKEMVELKVEETKIELEL